MTPRDSTHIAASQYDPQARTLRIQFRSGGTWLYHDVPQNVADAFHASESLGTVFMREIRDRFRHTVQTPRPVVRAGKVHVRLKPRSR